MSSATTRTLGRNGPLVSAVGLGLMGMTISAIPDGQMFETLDKAIETGCTFWDTSDAYGDNSERLQRYFAARPGSREKVFLATKVSRYVKDDGTPGNRADPEYLLAAADKVLQRLGLPFVDLIYLHRAEHNVPIEHSVGALKQLVEAGKTKYIGLSEVSARTVRRAHTVHPLHALQVEYSAFCLDIETNGVLDTCKELGIAVVCYSPVSRGFLPGELKTYADLGEGDHRKLFPRFSEENFPKNIEIAKRVEQIARQRGVATTQFALAWLLAQGEHVIPIPGWDYRIQFDYTILELLHGLCSGARLVLAIAFIPILNHVAGDATIQSDCEEFGKLLA
ncbi:Aldo/keto reductase [Auriculariales sp. MPI-PUGE-AT-0066]|nr:Aldo/keto reductase [Auriculariales sp. MPI-PUGE-AT-0066]